MLGRPWMPRAGVQEIIGAGVLREVRDHRADHARSSTHSGHVREQVADHRPLWPCCLNFHGDAITLPTLLNCVGSTLKTECGSLAVILVEQRLVVERIHLRRPAVHVQEDDTAGLGGMVQSGEGRRLESSAAKAANAAAPNPLRPGKSISRRVSGW